MSTGGLSLVAAIDQKDGKLGAIGGGLAITGSSLFHYGILKNGPGRFGSKEEKARQEFAEKALKKATQSLTNINPDHLKAVQVSTLEGGSLLALLDEDEDHKLMSLTDKKEIRGYYAQANEELKDTLKIIADEAKKNRRNRIGPLVARNFILDECARLYAFKKRNPSMAKEVDQALADTRRIAPRLAQKIIASFDPARKTALNDSRNSEYDHRDLERLRNSEKPDGRNHL